jgi:hypothetical protein
MAYRIREQIVQTQSNRDLRLGFESMNETSLASMDEEGSPALKKRAVVNRMNAAFVSATCTSGKNNETYWLMLIACAAQLHTSISTNFGLLL